tara:strand:+ start:65 stop:391 length:327 start_codon:yes stop_codon:yes gene_type:complete
MEIDTLFENMYPHTTPTEAKIKLLLVMKGYKRYDVHFRSSLNGQRYLRYGYWKNIEKNDIDYIQELENIQLDEFTIYDEDCGWLFGYDIKTNEVKHAKKHKENRSINL